MEVIKIAELSMLKSAFEKCTYEELFEKLLKTPTYSRLNDAKKLIDIELRKNGFKPVKKTRTKSKKDNPELRK